MPTRLRSVTLTSGAVLDVSDHLTVIVGPNNVGKTVALNSVATIMNQAPTDQHRAIQIAVDSITLDLPPREDFESFLSRAGAVLRPPGQYPGGYFPEEQYVAGGIPPISRSQLDQLYAAGNRTSHLGQFGSLVAVSMQPEVRLGQLGQASVPDLYSDTPTAPLQILWSDRSLEAKVAQLAKRAFGIDLVVNRHGGSVIRLHVGKPSTPEPPVGEKSPYLQEIHDLPLAANQGHGVQAFLGMLQILITRQYDIVLVDEPEAFLHPPQARLLGEIFVEFSNSGTQLVVSTHSDDFLRGVLSASAAATDVTVARLTKPTPTSNAIAQVPPAAVKKLFEDPLLRYSNILSGIFYKGVVLCEAESDCKYYAAIVDDMYATVDESEPRADLLFTQCGGKDRFAKAVAALHATRVPTAIIADVDLLADGTKFKELVELLGVTWSQIESDLNVIMSAAESRTTHVERQYAQVQIDAIFSASDGKYLDTGELRLVREAVTPVNGWKLIKTNGRGALPKGNAHESFERVLRTVANAGLFILPIGELESFHPTVAGSKQTWLRQVFEDGLYRDSAEARRLLTNVVAYIAGQQ